MQIPFELWNMSLWLASASIILLVSALLASAYNGQATILVDQKRLRNAALVTGILFLATVAIRIYDIATSK